MDKLLKYSICDISDALVKYGVKDGGFLPNLTMQSSVNSTVIGKAYTVLYAPKSDPRPEVSASYIDQLPANSVLIMGLPPSLQMVNAPYTKVNNALYGGLMSTRASYLKCRGSIILGRVRDLDEHNALEYPVWSYAVGSSAPGPVLKVVGINVPIEVKVHSIDNEYDIKVVEPNDILMGDNSGIVIIKESLLADVVGYVPKRVEADQNVANDIKNGRPA
ncbi:RraA-like protein, partial [Yamadazyma tenuis ATCC 10573]